VVPGRVSASGLPINANDFGGVHLYRTGVVDPSGGCDANRWIDAGFRVLITVNCERRPPPGPGECGCSVCDYAANWPFSLMP